MGGMVCTDTDTTTSNQNKGQNPIMEYFYPTEELTQEEAYILYREESLKLHTILTDDIIMHLEPLNENRYLSEKQFIIVLQKANLLPQEFNQAKDSIFWLRFYSKFKMNDIQKKFANLHKRQEDIYDKYRFLIGMTLLTKDDVKLKANHIFSLLTKVYVEKESEYIPIDNVRLWINTYLQIACNFLVQLASDYPKQNKTKFLKMFEQWNKNLSQIADQITVDFMATKQRLYQEDFVERCMELYPLFNTITLRKTVNRHILGI